MPSLLLKILLIIQPVLQMQEIFVEDSRVELSLYKCKLSQYLEFRQVYNIISRSSSSNDDDRQCF